MGLLTSLLQSSPSTLGWLVGGGGGTSSEQRTVNWIPASCQARSPPHLREANRSETRPLGSQQVFGLDPAPPPPRRDGVPWAHGTALSATPPGRSGSRSGRTAPPRPRCPARTSPGSGPRSGLGAEKGGGGRGAPSVTVKPVTGLSWDREGAAGRQRPLINSHSIGTRL